MRSTNTFGVHFIARPNQKGSHTIYARIVVNKSKCELGGDYGQREQVIMEQIDHPKLPSE